MIDLEVNAKTALCNIHIYIKNVVLYTYTHTVYTTVYITRKNCVINDMHKYLL